MTKILIAGATGLIGKQVAKKLANVGDLHIISRRAVEDLPLSVHQHIIDPRKWPDAIATISADIAISCLGTTWNNSGKNEAAFRAVDLDLVLMFAAAARKAGARHMISVSSVGASAKSSNFYLRTKGKAESGLKRQEFGRLDILHPGLLRGQRGGDRRLGEHIAIMASPFTDALLHGPLRRYRSIESATVADAIANLAMKGGQGLFIHENDAISTLAG